MWSRLLLPLLALFWVLMTVLLWRAEFGSGRFSGTQIPTEVILDKILTSPDSSSLAVFHGDQRVGFCHFLTTVGESLNRLTPERSTPEGMVRRVGDYQVQLSGNVALTEEGQRLRFDCELSLAKDRSWQHVRVRLVARPTLCEIHADAATGLVRVYLEDGHGRSERTLRLSDAQNPQALVGQLLGPAGALLLGALPLPLPAEPMSDLNLGLGVGLGGQWEARTDTMKIRDAVTRTYRLETRVLDRYPVVMILSRAGEILRVELPGEIVLVNEALLTL